MLFIRVIKPDKFPAYSGELKFINDNLVPCLIWASDTESAAVFPVNYGLLFDKALCRLTLLVKDFAITPIEFSFALDALHAIRHADRKL